MNAVKEVLTRAGFDAEHLVQQANTAAVKQRLTDNTEYALSKNVFGCPTYLYQDQLFFGGDRVSALLDVMHGFTYRAPMSQQQWPLRSPSSNTSSKL